MKQFLVLSKDNLLLAQWEVQELLKTKDYKVVEGFLILNAPYKKEEDLRFPLLLFMAIVGTGPFGLAGFLLQAALYPVFSFFSTSMTVWLEGLFPRKHMTAFDNMPGLPAGIKIPLLLFSISSLQPLMSLATTALFSAIASKIDLGMPSL